MTDLILLHGALGTKDQLIQIESVLSKNFKVRSFNFEGHGDRASNEPFSMDLFSQNLIDFMHAHKLKKAHMFGYSMGGYVALHTASKRPELADKIVTYGTKFDWTKETAEKEVKFLNPTVVEQKVPAFANQLAALHSHNDWKDVMSKTAQMMLNLGEKKPLSDQTLSEIKHQTLIIIGDQDHMVGIEESKNTAEAMPNGQLKIMEKSLHMIEKLDHKNLALHITDFLQ